MELKNPKADITDPPKQFTFDAAYDQESVQKDLYLETFAPLVNSVLEGFNGTIFAYGQTGAGKTFTMEGVKGDPELEGVIPRSFHHIFDRISNAPEDERYLVRASYLEIYQEEIRDLLSKVKKFLEPFVLCVQVNLYQKLSYLKQLTHNITRDCSLNSKKNTSSQLVAGVPSLKKVHTCCVQKLFFLSLF